MPSRINNKDKRKSQFSFLIPLKFDFRFSVSSNDEDALKFREALEKNKEEISAVFTKHILEILQSNNAGIEKIEDAFVEIPILKNSLFRLKEDFSNYVKYPNIHLSVILNNIMDSYTDETKRGNNEKINN